MSFEILDHHYLSVHGQLKKHYLPLASGTISCGLFGVMEDFSENDLSLDEKFMKNKHSTFFVRARGESMLPEIKPHDILIIDRSLKIQSGQVATFFFNGHAVCKQFVKNANQVILRSFHDDYPDIIVGEADQLELFGVVVGLARDFF